MGGYNTQKCREISWGLGSQREWYHPVQIKNKQTIDSWINFEDTISDFVIDSVPADGIAPFGFRLSRGTVVTEFGFGMYRWVSARKT